MKLRAELDRIQPFGRLPGMTLHAFECGIESGDAFVRIDDMQAGRLADPDPFRFEVMRAQIVR